MHAGNSASYIKTIVYLTWICISTYSQILIISHPEPQTVSDRGVASFRISISGSGPFFFEWMRNGHPVGRKYRSSYANSVHTIYPASFSKDNNTEYRCIVTNNSGDYIASDHVNLIIKTPDISSDNTTYILGNAIKAANFTWNFYCNDPPHIPNNDRFWNIYSERNDIYKQGLYGAHALQNMIYLYNTTEFIEYKKRIQRFMSWLRTRYSRSTLLEVCDTWYSPLSPNNSSDDAAWLTSIYIRYFEITDSLQYINLAYTVLKNSDRQWGHADNISAGRALRVRDNSIQNRIYIAQSIINALELYSIFTKLYDPRANICLYFAKSYYLFLENYLKSTHNGRGVYDFGYASDPKNPGGLPGSSWHNANPPIDLIGNLFGQVTVASVHMMLDELYKKGVSLDSAPWPIPYTDFISRALETADYIIDNLTEISTTTRKKILINTKQNPYVVGFGLYWWIKYIAPLKPIYGTILLHTAESILENFPQGDHGKLIQSCWSGTQESGIPDGNLSDPNTNYLCKGCRQIYRDDRGNNRAGEFLIHTSGASFLAAAAWIEKRRLRTKNTKN